MVAIVSHDHIEVDDTRWSLRKYIEFYEDIDNVLNVFLDKNLIHYLQYK